MTSERWRWRAVLVLVLVFAQWAPATATIAAVTAPGRGAYDEVFGRAPCCETRSWQRRTQPGLQLWTPRDLRAFWGGESGGEGGGAAQGGGADERLTWHIVVYGEPDDWDLELDGDVKGLRDLGFPPPVVHWAPSADELAALPARAPVILVAHTTDDAYRNDPREAIDPTDIAAGAFMPTPPRSAAYRSGDMFFWGWPEPFPFINNTRWFPAMTAEEGLRPFQRHPLVVLASCYGKKLEGVFPNVVGLSEGEYEVPMVYTTSQLLASKEMIHAFESYARSVNFTTRTLDFAQYYKGTFYERQQQEEEEENQEDQDAFHTQGGYRQSAQLHEEL